MSLSYQLSYQFLYRSGYLPSERINIPKLGGRGSFHPATFLSLKYNCCVQLELQLLCLAENKNRVAGSKSFFKFPDVEEILLIGV